MTRRRLNLIAHSQPDLAVRTGIYTFIAGTMIASENALEWPGGIIAIAGACVYGWGRKLRGEREELRINSVRIERLLEKETA